MTRTIEPGEVGLIVAPFIAADVGDENALDGFEDDVIWKLEDDLVDEVIMTRVLNLGDVIARIEGREPLDEDDAVPEPQEATIEILRERALNAADVAAAIMDGDEELWALLEPWFAKRFPHRKSVVRT